MLIIVLRPLLCNICQRWLNIENALGEFSVRLYTDCLWLFCSAHFASLDCWNPCAISPCAFFFDSSLCFHLISFTELAVTKYWRNKAWIISAYRLMLWYGKTCIFTHTYAHNTRHGKTFYKLFKLKSTGKFNLVYEILYMFFILFFHHFF